MRVFWGAVSLLLLAATGGCGALANSKQRQRQSDPMAAEPTTPDDILAAPQAAPELVPELAAPARESACGPDRVLRRSLQISEQRQLDLLEGCERIAGSLRLELFAGIDPAPLLSLRDVDGDLSVYGSEEVVDNPLDGFRSLEEARQIILYGLTLPSLEPLGRLRRVGADSLSPDVLGFAPGETSRGFEIGKCSGLESLAGLDALEHVDRFALNDNPDLVSLQGAGQLRGLDELRVYSCPLLGLQGIETFELRDLLIEASDLTDLQGLGQATRLSSLILSANFALVDLQGGAFPAQLEKLTLLNNPALSSLHGLEGLRQIEALSIQSDGQPSAFESFAGLEGLQQIGTLNLTDQTSLTHFTGLAALARVDSFYVNGCSALQDLEGLSSLREVGSLAVHGAVGLTRLTGLGSATIQELQLTEFSAVDLRGLEQVSIGIGLVSASQLSSLSGFPVLGAQASLSLQQLPALSDASALSPLHSLASLEVTGTALRDLDELGNLRSLQALYVNGNPALTQLQGVSAVTALGMMQVADNPLLERLPSFPNLTATCAECSALHLEISRNPLLETGPALPALERAGAIIIAHNPALSSLTGLAALRSVQSLRIVNNASLASLDLGQLAQAESIDVHGNRALDDAPLAALAQLPGASAQIVSNLSGPAQLSPCPWINDGSCDEQYGSCAPESDARDCPAP